MAALIGRDSLRSHIAYRYHIAAKQAGPVRYSLMDRQMAKFSERAGITPPKEIQTQSMDSDLRASLWNLCRRDWFTPHTADLSEDDIYSIATELYEDFYKLPVDSLPYHTEEFVKSQLELFISGPWYKVYDIVEFLCSGFHSGSIGQQQFEVNVNLILEREKAGYRMIDGRITPITNELELSAMREALSRRGDRFSPVAQHIKTSLSLYSKKPEPDYRNSIKEAISAVECVCKIISGKPKASLDDALDEVSKKHPLHTAFKQGVGKIYGWTSDADGIRHA